MTYISLTNFLDTSGNEMPDRTIESYNKESPPITLDGNHSQILMPALIDPHVHFRTPGAEHKENWLTGPKAALAGGISTVFDMPNTQPSTTSIEELISKKKLIDGQLEQLGLPFRYFLYFGASASNFHLFKKAFNDEKVIGIKIYMGSSTGDLLVHKEKDLDNIFQSAAQLEMPIGIHAEKEEILVKSTRENDTIEDHTQARPRKSAIRATEQALNLAHKYNNKIAILHLGTQEEMKLVCEAREAGLRVAIEVTPNHLFLDDSYYSSLGHKIKMNPPIREASDTQTLWSGLCRGVVDWVGSDHAPHTLEEKLRPYAKAPSGIPGVQTSLNLLLDRCDQTSFSLEQVQKVMRKNIQSFFNIKENDDLLIIDPQENYMIKKSDLLSKSGYSPFEDMTFRGSVKYVISGGKVVDLNALRQGKKKVIKT